MKKLIETILKPLARRAGTAAAGVIVGMGFMEPALAARVEAWATAGAFIAVDLLLAWKNAKTQEGR